MKTSSYQTSHSSSPPTPSLRADWPGHQPAGRGNNRNAHAADDRANSDLPDIAPRAGPRNALQIGDHAAAVRRVAQENAQRLLAFFFHHFEIREVAFVLQNARRFQSSASRTAYPHAECLATRAVANSRQKIGNGIGCHSLSSLPAGFHDAGNFSLEREAAETDAAHLELSEACRARARRSGSGCAGES